MNEITCLHCRKPMVNTPGKRAKKFCSTTCRSNFWQKNQRHKKAISSLRPATQLYAKSFGIIPASYDDFKDKIERAKNAEECQLIDKTAENSDLSGWQKREVHRMAVEKSKTFEF